MATFLVIDCESNGLYGESFAVGYTLINRKGERLSEGLIATEKAYAFGLHSDYTWVEENVKIDWDSLPANVRACRVKGTSELRQAFWGVWETFKAMGAYMAADCLFPVEANFMIDTVKQDCYHRLWDAPYPFIEISTLLIACGKDPTATYERLDDEEPQHNPLFDARQSARIMIDCFNQLNIFAEA
jgi:hypothetical protein